ncbi:unnamed protein product, partial [Rotaria sp. Silwood1]
MSNNSQYEKDSRGRINTNSTTRRQAFNTAKDVNDIPRCQSPDRQFKVQDKDTGNELRAWEYTNNKGQQKKAATREITEYTLATNPGGEK